MKPRAAHRAGYIADGNGGGELPAVFDPLDERLLIAVCHLACDASHFSGLHLLDVHPFADVGAAVGSSLAFPSTTLSMYFSKR